MGSVIRLCFLSFKGTPQTAVFREPIQNPALMKIKRPIDANRGAVETLLSFLMC